MTERNSRIETKETEVHDTEPPQPPLKKLSQMSDAEVMNELNELFGIEGLDNERRVMLYMARRYFVLGASTYRALTLHDGRDSVEESMQEGSDYIFYTAKRVLESE